MAKIRSRSSLLVGLLAISGAVLAGLSRASVLDVDEAVVAATLVVVLGAAGVIRSVLALLHRAPVSHPGHD